MKSFRFYGVCDTCYKLDDTVWEAREDPSDGYRSYLESIEVKTQLGNLTFTRNTLAYVYVKQNSEVEGWELVDAVDGHVWLTIGTDYSDDWYPQFVFRYTPKSKFPAWENFIQED